MSRNPTAKRPGKPFLRDFIVAYEGALSADICNAIVTRFEHDPRRQPSKTAAGVREAARSGTQIDMAGHPDWAELKKTVTARTVECLHDYAKRFSSIEFIVTKEEIFLSPPVVERVDPGQGFDWHIDSGPLGTHRRFLSALTYLNNIEKGGLTEFPLQHMALKPKQGTIVLFAPYWLFPHRGVPPMQETKYKMTAYFMVAERSQFNI